MKKTIKPRVSFHPRLVLSRETIHKLTLTDEEAKRAAAGCFCWSSHTDCRLGSCGICGG